MTDTKDNDRKCWFCGKTRREVKKLVLTRVQPGLYACCICDECVGLCIDLMGLWGARAEGQALAGAKEEIVRNLPGMSRCKDCDGINQVELKVWSNGYSVGSRHKHEPSCPRLRCPHGVLWADLDDCAVCTAEHEAENPHNDSDSGCGP